MSRQQAKLRRQAGEVIRALVAEVRAHASDYHHKTNEETLKRAAEFLTRLEKRKRESPKGDAPE
ncbi:MAG: hypothetical protein ACNA8S_09955 [Deferrisomatales bacterium]